VYILSHPIYINNLTFRSETVTEFEELLHKTLPLRRAASSMHSVQRDELRHYVQREGQATQAIY
jgi:hypothetical protein